MRCSSAWALAGRRARRAARPADARQRKEPSRTGSDDPGTTVTITCRPVSSQAIALGSDRANRPRSTMNITRSDSDTARRRRATARRLWPYCYSRRDVEIGDDRSFRGAMLFRCIRVPAAGNRDSTSVHQSLRHNTPPRSLSVPPPPRVRPFLGRPTTIPRDSPFPADQVLPSFLP